MPEPARTGSMAESARTAQREPAHWLTRHEPNRHAATLDLDATCEQRSHILAQGGRFRKRRSQIKAVEAARL
eukprot:8777344-Alexandrium_andersonii.AAC.1